LQHKNDINYNYIQEDEIDIKDLIRTLLRNKITISLITVLFTVIAIIYSLVKTPTYEVKSIISIGQYEDKLIETPQTLVARNTIIYIDNASKEEITSLEKVSLKKGTPNLVEFVVRSDTNENAIKKNLMRLFLKLLTSMKKR
jgi:LPS O-antigen subunit length determinant protein (WzzB/FepE family)